MMAFWQGMLAGYGIAIPVGAIAILIVEVALRRGLRIGFMAGAGAASADLLYAALAALTGTLLADWLRPLSLPLRVTSGLALLAIGGAGLWRLSRPPADEASPAGGDLLSGTATYVRFLGLTLLNPLTIAYFASLILGGGSVLNSWADRALFVFGAALASLSWQSLLAAFGALAHRRLPPRARLVTSVIGNLIVTGLGAAVLIRLALAL